MQVDRIQNTPYNARFTAKLELVGETSDIPQKIVKSWMRKAKHIGKENDTIRLRFFERRDYSREIAPGKQGFYENLNYFSRTGVGFLVNKEGNFLFTSPLSYKALKGTTSHEQMLTKNVNKFFDKLKMHFANN